MMDDEEIAAWVGIGIMVLVVGGLFYLALK